MIRTYNELIRLDTFEERFEYLKLDGVVGRPTFGYDRYINQRFYTSTEWKRARREVIIRDLGCDLAFSGREIHEKIIIHHMNPMEFEDIRHGREEILDIRFLISTTHHTHNAIHYGDKSLLKNDFIERQPGDTNLWG